MSNIIVEKMFSPFGVILKEDFSNKFLIGDIGSLPSSKPIKEYKFVQKPV